MTQNNFERSFCDSVHINDDNYKIAVPETAKLILRAIIGAQNYYSKFKSGFKFLAETSLDKWLGISRRAREKAIEFLERYKFITKGKYPINNTTTFEIHFDRISEAGLIIFYKSAKDGQKQESYPQERSNPCNETKLKDNKINNTDLPRSKVPAKLNFRNSFFQKMKQKLTPSRFQNQNKDDFMSKHDDWNAYNEWAQLKQQEYSTKKPTYQKPNQAPSKPKPTVIIPPLSSVIGNPANEVLMLHFSEQEIEKATFVLAVYYAYNPNRSLKQHYHPSALAPILNRLKTGKTAEYLKDYAYAVENALSTSPEEYFGKTLEQKIKQEENDPRAETRRKIHEYNTKKSPEFLARLQKIVESTKRNSYAAIK
jgi:hypothetical protein